MTTLRNTLTNFLTTTLRNTPISYSNIYSISLLKF